MIKRHFCCIIHNQPQNDEMTLLRHILEMIKQNNRYIQMESFLFDEFDLPICARLYQSRDKNKMKKRIYIREPHTQIAKRRQTW